MKSPRAKAKPNKPKPATPVKATDPAALRQTAESRLKEKQATSAKLTANDILRLHHELQVHQIELEMQNEELRAAQAEIEAGLERYTDLYDFAPVGYFNLTSDGTIKLANLTGALRVQTDRARLINRRFGTLVTASDRPAFNEFLARVFASGAGQMQALAMDLADRRPMTVSLDATLVPDGQECRVVLSDITVRLQQQESIMNLLAHAEHDAETKSELLREVNHRVTNNLTAVLGLMDFESKHLAGNEPHLVETLLARLELRIRGMLQVHQMLTKSRWSPVRVETLAELIIKKALDNAARWERMAVLKINPCELFISPRQAGALGMVLNELAYNTVKYVGEAAGAVTVGFEAEIDADWLTLRYRDNGPGYPSDVLANQRSSVGLKLIHELVTGTLGGSIALSNDHGAVITIRIRCEEANRT